MSNSNKKDLISTWDPFSTTRGKKDSVATLDFYVDSSLKFKHEFPFLLKEFRMEMDRKIESGLLFFSNKTSDSLESLKPLFSCLELETVILIVLFSLFSSCVLVSKPTLTLLLHDRREKVLQGIKQIKRRERGMGSFCVTSSSD